MFAEEHVLVAVIAETLVEGVGQHLLTTDEEIGGVEVAIGGLLTFLYGMILLGSLFIAIAEIAFQIAGIATDGNAAINDIVPFRRQVSGDVVRPQEGHVAVDEQQMVVLSRLSQKVANCGPTDVVRLSQILAMRPLADLAVLANDIRICRTIVGHQDLVDDTSLLSLLTEPPHQTDAQVVIGGNQYR